ncbi:MAG: hypothetical protein WBB65_14700 [Anaerolineales bacterium]
MAPQSLTTIEEAMEFATEAISRGEIQVGKDALTWVLQQSPSHPTAWMWMACCVSDESQKQDCYRQIPS